MQGMGFKVVVRGDAPGMPIACPITLRFTVYRLCVVLLPLLPPPQVEGITLDIMATALQQAKAGRRHILQQMSRCDPPPSGKLAQGAPRLLRTRVRREAGRTDGGGRGKRGKPGWDRAAAACSAPRLPVTR